MFGFVGGNEFFCVIRAIRYHIEAALRPERCPIAPYFFFDNLNYFSPDFQRYQQEDAHEFLQAFLEKLEICGSDRTSFRGDITSQDVFSGRLISGVSSLNFYTLGQVSKLFRYEFQLFFL
jgi:uncharacterized UBP type Zn finger protein